jgi:hypothetical protein
MEIEDSDGALHTETINTQVINLGGNHDIFISYDWLKKHNPQINWRLKEFQLPCDPEQCNITHPTTQVQSLEEYIQLLNRIDEGEPQHESEHIRAFQTTSTRSTGEAPKQEIQIPRHYREFKDVFEKKEFDKLPERQPWDHKIKLLPGAEADRKVKGKIYALNPEEQVALNAFLKENLKSGRIRPSQSLMASPFFFVKKKDKKLQPVQDYRTLNAHTVKDSYPLPLISDVITRIKDTKIFSKFDIMWGFNNIRIREGDKWKAVFITNRGLYKPLVMFFGLSNSPATFQHMMDDIFVDMIHGNLVIIYMDDILVFSKDLEAHQKTV